MPTQEQEPAIKSCVATGDKLRSGFGAISAGATTFIVRQRMIRLLASLILVATSSGCARISDDEARLLAQAKSVQHFPILRSTLLTTLGLHEAQSERTGGRIRSGHIQFSETWQLQSGLSVIAYDSQYVSRDAVITRESINDILSNPDRRSKVIVGGGSPRDTFNGFSIFKGDKVIYRSDANQGEQAGSSSGG
jgi:hypothetical protein